MKKVENYLLNERIGQGSFGQVYKAYDLSTGTLLAVKQIPLKDQQLRLSTTDEIEVLKAISHPNALSLFGVRQTINNLYIATEFCEDGDLATYLRDHGPPSQAQVTEWLSQLLDCLKALHTKGIMHRDLKPENILITRKSTLKIADFGLSCILGAQQCASTTLGTPLYMAPEVLNCQNYGTKVDIWSLGVVAYQLITGKLPFVCQRLSQFIRMQRRPVAWPKEVSENLRDLVEIMLTPNPAHRPTASDLLGHAAFQNA